MAKKKGKAGADGADQGKEQKEPRRKFRDVDEFVAACDAYFAKCDQDGVLYNEAGLCLHLGISMFTWDSWWEGKRCPDLMEAVRMACMRITNQILTDIRYQSKGGMTSVAIFLLKQKRLGGYQDKIEAKQDIGLNITMGHDMDESDFK